MSNSTKETPARSSRVVTGDEAVMTGHAPEQTGSDQMSWSAIFAGAACGLALYLVLGLIGLSVGIGMVDPAEENNPLAGVPTGVGMWWSISAIAAFFAAGLIAGRLAGWQSNATGALHGMTVGAVTLLLVTYVASSTIGSTVSGAAGAVAALFSQSERRSVMVTVSSPGKATAPGGSGAAGSNALPPGISASQQSPSDGQARQNVSMQQVREAIRTMTDGSNQSSQSSYYLANYLQFEVIQAIRQEAGELIAKFITERERQRISKAIEATYADLIETPKDAAKDVRDLFELLLSNDGVLGAEDRRQAKAILVERMGLEDGEAERVLQRWKQRYEKAVGDLKELVSDAQAQLSDIASRQREILNDAAGEAAASIRKVVDEEEQKETLRITEQSIDDIVNTPGDATADLQRAFDRLFGENGVWSQEDVNELRALLEEQTGLSEEDAQRVVNRWQKRYQAAVERTAAAYETVRKEAVEAAESALDTLAATAGWASFAFVLALSASTLGGMLGRPSGPPAMPVFSRRRRTDDDSNADDGKGSDDED